jgi:hypothetical protein
MYLLLPSLPGLHLALLLMASPLPEWVPALAMEKVQEPAAV